MPIRLLALLIALLTCGENGFGQLQGTYSVDPTRQAGPRNFSSLSTAMQALATQGISAAVILELSDRAGPYRDAMPFTAANVAWGQNNAVLVLREVPGATPVSRVTIRAAAGHRPVFDATGLSMGVFWNGADYVTLEGIEIRGATYDAISIYSENSHGRVEDAIIRGCRLHSCGGSGIVIYGNLPAPVNTLIENNLLYDLQQVGGGGFANLARNSYINTRRAHGTRIRNNTIVATTGMGPWFALISSNPGSLDDEPIAELLNNILVKAVRSDRPLFSFPTISGIPSVPLLSEYNVIGQGLIGPLAATGSQGTVVLQTLFDWQMATLQDGASFEADPLFEDLATRNFRPRENSVAIDSAIVMSDSSKVDADGVLRFGRPDRGALEHRGMQAPSARQFGQGAVGVHGVALELSALSAPALGDSQFALHHEGAANTASLWLFGAASVQSDQGRIDHGGQLLLDLGSMMSFLRAGFGPMGPFPVGPLQQGLLPFPLPNDPRLQGATLALQMAAVEQSHSGPSLQLSNALVLTLN